METNNDLSIYTIIIGLWVATIIGGYSYFTTQHENTVKKLGAIHESSIAELQSELATNEQEFTEQLASKNTEIENLRSEIDSLRGGITMVTEDNISAYIAAETLPYVEADPSPTTLTIKTPGAGTALCLGETEHLQWSTPKEWYAVRILLQDALTGRNWKIGIAEAAEGIHVWKVGEIESQDGDPAMAKPGKYKIDIVWQGHDYNANHQTSEVFEIIDC